jgi:hypothetical protein
MARRETTEAVADGVLVALVRACRDDRRPAIREKGHDERDLAYESDLLQEPSEVESTVYGSQKRNMVLRVLRKMQRDGLISMEMGSNGVYRVLPTSKGEEYAEFLMLPWYAKLWKRLRGRASQPI